MDSCVFCKILNKELPCYKIYEDDVVLAFLDIAGKDYGHTLVIPKAHVESLNEVNDFELIKKMFEAVKKINKQENITHFKTLINTGAKAGQEVMHLHIHILSD